MKKVILFIGIIVFLAGIVFYFFVPNTLSIGSYYIKGDNKNIDLISANTDEKRIKGLSGRDSLSDDEAMFFIFDKIGRPGIWMKDMKFSIDIIWLDIFKKVVHIENNVSPSTYPAAFFPPTDSLYVIEGNDSFIEKNSITVGNFLDIKKK